MGVPTVKVGVKNAYHPGPNNQNGEEGGGGLLNPILAVVISVIVVSLIVSTSRRHAAALDEGTLAAATAPASTPAKLGAPTICLLVNVSPDTARAGLERRRNHLPALVK